MITDEEKQVFESELKKLTREYQTSQSDLLKSKIKEDISFLQSVLHIVDQRNDEVNKPDQ